MTAPLILLNGSSSSGKSTLALMLQQLLPEPYQYLSLDQFRDGFPERVRGLNAPAGSEGARGLNVLPVYTDKRFATRIEFGDFGARVLSQMRETAGRLASRGIPVIVDDLLFSNDTLRDYLAYVDIDAAWLVGVFCPLEELERRESQRPGRFPGTAYEHFERVHEHVSEYDIRVDTNTHSPRQAAMAVIQRMASAPVCLRKLAEALDPP